MNAYELADEFKNRDWDEVDCVLWCEKSANMLRQQADEILVLKRILADEGITVGYDYLNDCVATLRRAKQ